MGKVLLWLIEKLLKKLNISYLYELQKSCGVKNNEKAQKKLTNYMYEIINI